MLSLLKTQEINGRTVTEQESLLVEVFDYINAVQVSTIVLMRMMQFHSQSQYCHSIHRAFLQKRN